MNSNSDHSYLIIGGSTKCGTTSVFNYLEFHPQVCACSMKESRYFWYDTYPLIAAGRSADKSAGFDSLFTCKSDQLVRLEATPDYLYSIESAQAIKQSLNKVRFVFILREPVDRLRSWYKFARMNGLLEATISFSQYIDMQKSGSDKNTPQHLRALEQGLYFSFLQTYIDMFGSDKIKVLFYEDLAADPKAFCVEICEFASIDASYFNDFSFRIYNPSVAAKNVKLHTMFRKMKRTVRPFTRMFGDSIRKRLKLAGYRAGKAFTSANSSSEEMDLSLSPLQLQWIENYYVKDKEQLKSYLGSKLPWQDSKRK
jgi:Sulfotransferase domain